jgi:hypothetical protein
MAGGDGRGVMDEKEYEGTYQAALRQIKTKGDEVGEPYLTHDGVRSVHIKNFPCTDELVFKGSLGRRGGSRHYARAIQIRRYWAPVHGSKDRVPQH